MNVFQVLLNSSDALLTQNSKQATMIVYKLLDELGNVILTTHDYTTAYQHAMEHIFQEFFSLDTAYRIQVLIRRRRGLIETNFYVYFEDSSG